MALKLSTVFEPGEQQLHHRTGKAFSTVPLWSRLWSGTALAPIGSTSEENKLASKTKHRTGNQISALDRSTSVAQARCGRQKLRCREPEHEKIKIARATCNEKRDRPENYYAWAGIERLSETGGGNEKPVPKSILDRRSEWGREHARQNEKLRSRSTPVVTKDRQRRNSRRRGRNQNRRMSYFQTQEERRKIKSEKMDSSYNI
jgi:hypothetical protein